MRRINWDKYDEENRVEDVASEFNHLVRQVLRNNSTFNIDTYKELTSLERQSIIKIVNKYKGEKGNE